LLDTPMVALIAERFAVVPTADLTLPWH